MRIDAQRGFTLLEMMVVLLIMGIAMGAASVSAFGDPGMRTLRQDAHRLAGLFMAAQTEARAGGGRIAWRPGAQGYAFERLPRPLVLPARMAVRSAGGGTTASARIRPCGRAPGFHPGRCRSTSGRPAPWSSAATGWARRSRSR
ncbi:prepilin-type N-terminal cleavage/methylation domain-containing protein [Castellaniella defragrans]|uniref:prepilin-type N-terminal cleavage/methylation domain-containing protein n=1 Tax=Castellaniella defragrans TaxID=75697 RepID=UPI0006939647|nr:prepilin-type N-terminal cleavage/methylation domain-containing protein [Castellaniella defragrans]